MSFLKIFLGVLIALSASRFIPHPPNFTSLIALSFYIPAIFGKKYIPVVLIVLAMTDLIIGFHSTIFFTWGSVILIGLISQFFLFSLFSRIAGSLLGACIFFIVTNFGVWLTGSYGYTVEGFILCYTLAIPFFAYNLISTFFFSAIIETINKFYSLKIRNNF